MSRVKKANKSTGVGMSEQEEVIRIGCNMHARRYFKKSHKSGAKSGKTLAEVGLSFYKTLFDIEDELRDKPHLTKGFSNALKEPNRFGMNLKNGLTRTRQRFLQRVSSERLLHTSH